VYCSCCVSFHIFIYLLLIFTLSISDNAAINAWSKSYHPSAGEMAELLLGEMMREWRFGQSNDSIDYEDGDVEMSIGSFREDDDEDDGDGSITKKGNGRVRPDVVTFTAVIDAWVKCTALAHDYHYEPPPKEPYSSNRTTSKFRKEKESYVEWKRNQASKADALTKRAATRAKQLLELMIQLSHYDPTSSNKCEPCMRPNCYTYSAVMNALAKSCSALRAVSPSGFGETNYDPAREAQTMLESMIEKYQRYKNRVGEPETWKSADYGQRFQANDSTSETDGESDANNDLNAFTDNVDTPETGKIVGKLPRSNNVSPWWFDPRPDEITFPPNTINYNSVLNAWSRASRYDSQSAMRAEQILLERMETPQSRGGDAVEPDALSYSLVIHAWLRGCRGFNGTNGAHGRNSAAQVKFTDQERINRAMKIVDRMEAWARNNEMARKSHKDDEDAKPGDDHSMDYNDVIIDDEEDDNALDSNVEGASGSSDDYTKRSLSFRSHNKAHSLDVEVYK
jgi:hypothetical protein